MKKTTRILSFFVALTILLASCSSTTLIQSNPSNAKLFIDGQHVGQTPYSHRDTKIVGSTIMLKIEKEGYQPLITTITKDEEVNVGAIVGGLFFVVPFLWTMQYQPMHHYELKSNSAVEKEQILDVQKIQTYQKSRVERLRELKQLLDEKIITNEEFEKEKAKILEMKE